MFKLFRKNHLSALMTLLSLMVTPLMANDCCYYPSGCNRLYIGGFGGGIYSNTTRLSQTGVAFFTEAEGGPLAVYARGRSHRKSSGFGGAQIGYELAQSPFQIGCSGWSITPAAEIEAYFYRHKKKGALINQSDRLPEHDFHDSFPMHTGVYLVNGVLTLNNCCLGNFSPYIGGGVGAAHISIRGAKSLQVSPPEVGVNHFNSKRSDSAWAFAAQAKAGIRYNIFERFHIFAEYRFSFVDSSDYNFGSTVFPGHAPTTTWIVNANSIYYNAFAIGIQFDL